MMIGGSDLHWHDIAIILGGAVVTLISWIFKNMVQKSIDKIIVQLEKSVSHQANQDVEMAKVRTHMEHLHSEMFNLTDVVKKIYIVEAQAETAIRTVSEIKEIKTDLNFLHDKLRRVEINQGSK